MPGASAARAAFAALFIVLGIHGLLKGDFAAVWAPVPKGVPAREALAYLCALVSLTSGAGLLVGRAAAGAARMLLGFLVAWWLFFRLPGILRAPGAVLSWDAAAETAGIVAGAWVLYARLAADPDRRRLGFATGDRGVRIARVLYGLSLIPFGLVHFAYVKETAVLVPRWLPSPLAWAHLTGWTFLAAAAGVLLGVFGRLAAALSALQIALFTLLIWVPIVAAGSKDPFQWSELAISSALAAAAWVVAESYRGTHWLAVRKRSLVLLWPWALAGCDSGGTEIPAGPDDAGRPLDGGMSDAGRARDSARDARQDELPPAPPILHRLYALNAGPTISVYDLDSADFHLVKEISAGTSTEDVRGGVGAMDGMLYISYGCGTPTGCTPYLMKYDMLTDKPVWARVVSQGIDSHAISPDGKVLYMPTGENDFAHESWLVIDSATGDVTGEIDSGIGAPHNTIVSRDGSRVYLDATGVDSSGASYLVVASTADRSIVRRIGPVLNHDLRPFTIDADERFAFLLPMGFVGFQVGDIASGAILYTVPAAGYTCPWMGPGQSIGCNHGISLSPDGREIYMVDYYNNRVHVFDVTGLPWAAPKHVSSVKLAHPFTYSGAWVTHTRDGRYALVGRSGDVIDTTSRAIVGFIPALSTTKVYTEVDLQAGRVVFTPLSRSGVGYPTPGP